jgi:O-antigen/teichoic acid export membrane protein
VSAPVGNHFSTPADGNVRDAQPFGERVAGRHSWAATILTFAAGKAFPGLLTLASIPLWVNSFGASNYGLFSLYWTASLIGTSLTLGWLNQAILRQTGTEGASYEALPWRTRWLVEAGPACTVVPLAIVTWPLWEGHEDRWTFLLSSLVGLLINGRYAVRQTISQRDARATPYAVAETVRVAVALMLSLTLAASGLVAPWSLVAANSAGMLLALTILIRSERRMACGLVKMRVKGPLLGAFWRFGWPLSLWLACSSSMMYLDRLVISHLYGLEKAGDYAAAADLVVRGMGMVAAPVIMFLHPAFMRAWNTRDRGAALAIWRRMTSFLALGVGLTGAIILLAYAAFSGSVLDNPPSIATFAALIVGGIVWQMALMLHKPLEASGRTLTMLGALIGSLLVTLTADLLLAPRLGLLGVALGFMSGALCYAGLVAVLNVRVLRPAELGTQTS